MIAAGPQVPGAVIRSFRGHTPQLGAGVFVAEQTAIIGDVVIGAGSTIWYGTVIRGDVMPIRIGAATSIQDNSVVHVTGDVSGTAIAPDPSAIPGWDPAWDLTGGGPGNWDLTIILERTDATGRDELRWTASWPPP